jgi:NADH-quinone oxidoreductase subunit L
MPVTFGCFIVAALSISGAPPFNGFFSKELIYDAAWERNSIFYVAAILGSFFTAASFLKLGHAAFLGNLSEANKKVKEAPITMLMPMIIIAGVCVLFGVYNYLPINNFIQPILGEARLEGHHFYGMPSNMFFVWVTILVLIAALINHITGVKLMGSGLKAVDHIHHAPALSTIYGWAQKRYFDPYDIGMKFTALVSTVTWRVDRAIDWVYDNLSVGAGYVFSIGIRRAHTGNLALYVVWSLLGVVLVTMFMVR